MPTHARGDRGDVLRHELKRWSLVGCSRRLEKERWVDVPPHPRPPGQGSLPDEALRRILISSGSELGQEGGIYVLTPDPRGEPRWSPSYEALRNLWERCPGEERRVGVAAYLDPFREPEWSSGGVALRGGWSGCWEEESSARVPLDERPRGDLDGASPDEADWRLVFRGEEGCGDLLTPNAPESGRPTPYEALRGVLVRGRCEGVEECRVYVSPDDPLPLEWSPPDEARGGLILRDRRVVVEECRSRLTAPGPSPPVWEPPISDVALVGVFRRVCGRWGCEEGSCCRLTLVRVERGERPDESEGRDDPLLGDRPGTEC